jgi:predicted nucleic acid-binding Zn ribbon protein
MMLIAALAGIALLFFTIICVPNILMEALARRKARKEGVEYEPLCKPIKFHCPECGFMDEEDYGFCSRCGGMFAKEVRREVPITMNVTHERLT